MSETSIEWTDVTWNPVRGCSRVSAGCENCYAMRQAHRFNTPPFQDPSGDVCLDRPAGPYHRLTNTRRGMVDWSGVVKFVPEKLGEPLRWKKPRRVFVNSMSDLFHPQVSDTEIAAVFGVMAAAPQHTFQVLTKRPERMRRWFEWIADVAKAGPTTPLGVCVVQASQHLGLGSPDFMPSETARWPSWPLPNVWLGVSVEDQATANKRIPLLLETPAAVRLISAEPLLGPIDLTQVDFMPPMRNPSPHDPLVRLNALTGHIAGPDEMLDERIDWVIVGSESGPRARPMQIEWAASLRDQCKAAGVAFFTKQIANERDRKGGNPEFWPHGDWPREFPEVAP